MHKNIHLIKEAIEKNLQKHLDDLLPNHKIKKTYEYATMPPGKLFRPLLVAATAADFLEEFDLKKLTFKSNHSLLASAIEIHHAYTLVHDDLPSMDNDDFRRGKPSTHKAFSEWEAILVGDGLLNSSYRLLSKIDHPNAMIILKIFSHALGAKGLIHGQVIDLSSQMKESFNNILTAHELKTARLIQVSLIASYLLTITKNSTANYRTAMDLGKLGLHTGLLFQLIDDLSELTEEIGIHESEINPWIHFSKQASEKLLHSLKRSDKIIKSNKLKTVHEVMKIYYSKMLERIETGLDKINQNLISKDVEINLDPVITMLNRINS